MCGLVGWFRPGEDARSAEAKAALMLSRIEYRGPDERHCASGKGWGVGHARLAIIDPKNGSQPLWNATKGILIIGNNEIYNAPELRAELEKKNHVFKTGSDTEVILEAWEEWGNDAFARLNGMFAVAIVDTKKKRCLLARDPLGIKPLHWMRLSRGFAFASEIKSLMALPEGPCRPNRDSLHVFMNLRFLPGNQTLFEGVERLPPGEVLELDWESGAHAIHRFFDWEKVKAQRSGLSFGEAAEAVSTAMDSAVRRHLLSDVEVGAYLSGGVDSSIVATLASRHSPGIRTFCMGFGEPSDENEDARRIARAIHARHEDFNLAGHALDLYADALWHVEEPKINCIQNYALAQSVSRRGLKVVLSGLGGDELFAGYVNNDFLFPMTGAIRWLGTSDQRLSLSGLQGLVARALSFRSEGLFFRGAELLENFRNPLQYYAILRNAFDHNPFLMKSIYAHPEDGWRNSTVNSLAPYFDGGNPDVLNELLTLEMRTKLVNDFLLGNSQV